MDEIYNSSKEINIVTIKIEFEPKIIVLSLDEAKKIDLDNDSIDDIEIKFEDVYVNRIELIIISLFEEMDC